MHTHPGRLATFLLPALAVLALPTAVAQPLGRQQPTDQEQAGLYYLNRARSNPAAYGDEIDLDLRGVQSRPALAISRELTGSARFHAAEMLEHDYFAHVSEVTGDGPNLLAAQNGYDLFGAGLEHDWTTENFIESLAFGFNSIGTFPSAIDLLIIDKGVPDLGHRVHLLAMSAGFVPHQEVGFGRASDGNTHYYAIHTGYVSPSDRFVTGVVFSDTDGDGLYDAGEGLADVTVGVGPFEVQSNRAGGYSVAVLPGTYEVTCNGGGFTGVGRSEVQIGASNVEVDFRSGVAVGEVDFEFQFGGAAPQPPVTQVDASVTSGMAPLSVVFTAEVQGDATEHAWDFGDGVNATGETVFHTFTEPGLYRVAVSTLGPGGTAASTQLVAVSGANGAGAETTAPSSTALTPKNVKGKVKFKSAGRDVLELKGTLELPAGFVPEIRPAEVCIAGVCFAFTLDATNKAKDEAGNKFALKYAKPKGGAPLPAGVIAKVVVKLKGDFRARLAQVGVQDVTEKRTLGALPFAFRLRDLAYRGEGDFALSAKAGKRATLKLIKE